MCPHLKKGEKKGDLVGRIFALKKSLFHLPYIRFLSHEGMEGEGGCAGDNLPLIPS